MQDVAEWTLRLPSLKTFTLNVGLCDRGYEKRVADLLCSCILEGSPLLKSVRICVGHNSETIGRNRFDGAWVETINDLARRFPKTNFFSVKDEDNKSRWAIN